MCENQTFRGLPFFKGNSLGFLFSSFEKNSKDEGERDTHKTPDTNEERERERERKRHRKRPKKRIHDQRVLREAREDRPGDVREGVQSERTSDGETGGVEEDAIGGELFVVLRVLLRSFLFPGKRPPPPFVFFGFARRARECFGPTAEREREASAVTRTAFARARARALFRRVVGSFTRIERAR